MHIHTLLAVCRRFAIVSTFDNSPLLEIRLDVFPRSTIAQKHFIKIIIVIIIKESCNLMGQEYILLFDYLKVYVIHKENIFASLEPNQLLFLKFTFDKLLGQAWLHQTNRSSISCYFSLVTVFMEKKSRI